MRAFLGTETGREFDRIVIHEILPAIAKAYSSIDVCVETPCGATNEIIKGIHEHFLDVVADFSKKLLTYHLSPDAKTDDMAAENVRKWRERVNPDFTVN